MKKLAIVGGSPATQHLAPYDDPTFDIWVHGNQLDRHKGRRITRVFEIHDDLSEHQEGYAAWLAEQRIPLIVGRKFPFKGEGITTYPYDLANALMGQHLTSTPAYMMALAILEGYQHISIFGVDMAVDDHEYFYQRPCMYAWIAYAKAKGIEIYIPKESGLFKDSYVEGDKDGKPDLGLVPFTQKQFDEMASLHIGKIKELENQIIGLQMKMNAHAGSKQAYERLSKIARAIEAGADVKTLTESLVIK